MKKKLHPEYKKCIVTCACGNTFETRSTLDKIHVEICSKCHPFYTGKQKLIDSAGRVEQYIRKYSKSQAETGAGVEAAKDVAPGKESQAAPAGGSGQAAGPAKTKEKKAEAGAKAGSLPASSSKIVPAAEKAQADGKQPA